MMNILVVSPNYPYESDSVYPFVKSLFDEVSKNGWNVFVLAPQSVTSALLHRKKLRPQEWTYIINKTRITVFQPYSYTPLHGLLGLYNYMIRRSALRFLHKKKLDFDVCYCHLVLCLLGVTLHEKKEYSCFRCIR